MFKCYFASKQEIAGSNPASVSWRSVRVPRTVWLSGKVPVEYRTGRCHPLFLLEQTKESGRETMPTSTE